MYYGVPCGTVGRRHLRRVAHARSRAACELVCERSVEVTRRGCLRERTGVARHCVAVYYCVVLSRVVWCCLFLCGAAG